MRYLLLIYEASRPAAPTEDEWGTMMAEYFAYTAGLPRAGGCLGGEALQPTSRTATTVRVRDGQTRSSPTGRSRRPRSSSAAST